MTKKKVETMKPKKKKIKVINTVGKRKRAIARAIAKSGTGEILINSKSLNIITPEIVRLLISEPVILAGDVAKRVNIDVNVHGGGIFGQAEASREAIAKALVAFDSSLKQKFLEYDRTLLISDSRRTEPHKPSASKRGSRRHKQRSKR